MAAERNQRADQDGEDYLTVDNLIIRNRIRRAGSPKAESRRCSAGGETMQEWRKKVSFGWALVGKWRKVGVEHVCHKLIEVKHERKK